MNPVMDLLTSIASFLPRTTQDTIRQVFQTTESVLPHAGSYAGDWRDAGRRLPHSARGGTASSSPDSMGLPFHAASHGYYSHVDGNRQQPLALPAPVVHARPMPSTRNEATHRPAVAHRQQGGDAGKRGGTNPPSDVAGGGQQRSASYLSRQAHQLLLQQAATQPSVAEQRTANVFASGAGAANARSPQMASFSSWAVSSELDAMRSASAQSLRQQAAEGTQRGEGGVQGAIPLGLSNDVPQQPDKRAAESPETTAWQQQEHRGVSTWLVLSDNALFSSEEIEGEEQSSPEK